VTPQTQTAQVAIESLTKTYGALRAVDSLSFDIHQGEWVALMGPSGSGKTTLINVLGGLDTLTSGRVVVDGVDLAKLSENQLVRYRAEKVGFVMLAQYFHSITDESQAAEALRRVGLGDRLTHLPAQLSGGEQQRVAIARALINQPKLILADEPTGNLDEPNEIIVMELFRELHRAGHTILMVTHDPDIARQADRRIELQHGRLHYDSTLQGPNHPMLCPLANTVDCCSSGAPTGDDQIRFDHLLEQIWIFGEEGKPARVDALHPTGPAGSLPLISDESPARILGRMAELQLVQSFNGHVELTDVGTRRARDVVRRHRLAERLFKDTFAVEDSEAHSQACKFEHIISPELDERICTFLGHPTTCPHGNPIPPGECCEKKTISS
jgi:putative ABC transport system ATP-binding protein